MTRASCRGSTNKHPYSAKLTMNEQRAVPAWQQAIVDKCYHPTGQWIEFPRSALDASLVARFEEMVLQYPDHLALKTGDEEFTYAELNASVNRVTHALLQVAAQPPQFVALLFEHGAAAVIAILAVLKAGSAYLPLDPAFPLARNRTILQDAQTPLLLTNHRNWALAGTLSNGRHRLLNMDDAASYPLSGNPGLPISPDALCHILYTSGSTGRPRGVMQNHRNQLHCILQNSTHLHICAQDRFPLFSSYSTVAGAYSIFCALLNGASLFPYAIQEKGVTGLARWLADEAITFCDLVPTVFPQIVGTLADDQRMPHLRVLYLGGERVDPQDVAAYKRYLAPSAILATGLAATETCSEVCLILIDKETELADGVVPVGYAMPGMTICFLDEARQPVGPNQIGEIAVKSPYLALGYWQQPNLTTARFLPDTEGSQQRIYLTGDLGLLRTDGAIIHKGRNDFQLKTRGNRVDIGEIEAALLTLGWVKQAAVTGVPRQSGDDELVAYLVPYDGLPLQELPTISQVRKALAGHLPAFMIPAEFVYMAELPLTATGKIDRTALPGAPAARRALDAAFLAPRTPIETALAAIWGSILEIAEVGVDDPFLDLGGSSLQAMRIAARVNEDFGVNSSLADLFAAFTVAEMALVIAAQLTASMGGLTRFEGKESV